MTHWAMKYIGEKWTPMHDCYYWFRKIMVDEFGHTELPAVDKPHDESMRTAARLFTRETANKLGWTRIEDPQEGDAVYLTQGKNCNTHIGVIFFAGGKRMVLHAMKNIGVVASDAQNLKLNSLIERSFWRHANSV